MRPRKSHKLFLSIFTATVLSCLGLGIAFPVIKLGSDTKKHYNYTEKAQVPKYNSQFQVKLLNEQAIKLSGRRQFTQALQRLQTALDISREIAERPLEAATLNNIGRVYEKQGNSQQAFKYFLQALFINKELTLDEKNPGGNRIAFGKTYSNLGNLFHSQKKADLAIFFFKHCVNNREQVRLNPAAFSLSQVNAYSLTVAQTYRALGEELLKENRVAEALRIMDLVKVEQLEEYIGNVRGNQNTVKGIQLQATEKPVKQELEKTLNAAIPLGKELTTLRKIPPEKRSPQQTQRLAQLVQSQQQLVDEFQNFVNSPAVQAQVEQINRTAKRQNLDLESLNELRDNLAGTKQKSVLLYPLILKDSLELVVLTPDAPPIRRSVAVKRETLNQTIVDFRKALQNPSLNVKKPAQQLHNWLIAPIENDLKLSGAQTIIYAPDDQLRYIPLAALHDGKQWLIQRYGVNHITAASLTNFNTPPSSQLRVLAAAFTKGNYQLKVGNRQLAFSGLPFAAKEVDNLAATVPRTKKILDTAFSVQATVPQMDDYTIVHLATHAAFVVGKPEDSFILFGNGDRATLKDVATWSLPSVDLMVLSACETGLGGFLGNGEEILGFGYQVQKTGAKSTIASLWVVDDGGTQTLMSAFYALLPTGKLSKSEALRQAQIALITGNMSALRQMQPRSNNIPASVGSSLNHPYYWAPFILIGNGL